jgi:archaellum biogenesis ATPase FlaH|tara:strand:- start:3077 stop:4900 length:1824 start_codon:yes stop_codon:yes gene_type:complete
METNNWWVEYATASVSNRNHLCELKEFPNVAAQHQNLEIYRSMFLYDADIVEFVAKNDTVTGFNGTQGVDKLVIDIDYIKNDNNMGNETRLKVLDVIDKMEKLLIQPEHYNIWFSGKGFHIHLGNVYGFENSNQIAKQVRATMQRDFGDHIDIIYDSRRLIRVGHSYNKKSKLYKIPISYTELSELEYLDIAELAQEIRTSYKPHKISKEKVTGLDPMDMSRKNIEEVRKVFDNAKGISTRYITCVQHIYNAGHVPSNRHKHLLALTSIWRKKYAFDKVACDHLARAYMAKMDNPLDSVEVSRIVSDAFKNDYNYGCNHPVLQPYCDSKCLLYKYKNLDEETNILNAEQMVNKLIEHYTSDFTDRSFDLKDIFTFMPKTHLFTSGQLITLIGDTGLGKTAFISYLITQLPKIKILFLSLEVDDLTMSRRFLQAAMKKTKADIINIVKSGNIDSIEQAQKSIDNIQLETVSPDIQDLSSFVAETEAKIVVVDTIDRIPAKYAGKDDFARQEVIANGLKDLAMKEDVIVLAVHHISKSASYNFKETNTLDVHSGKGNSAIEQKSDQYIAFQGKEMSKSRVVKSLKARDESKFELLLNYNWDTFTFDKRN